MKKIVQRANKQLQVPEERLQDMLNRGYVEVDAKGKPVAKPPKNDLKALKAENEKLKEINKALTEEVAALTKQLEEKSANTEE